MYHLHDNQVGFLFVKNLLRFMATSAHPSYL